MGFANYLAATNYAGARELFAATCADLGLDLEPVDHPERGAAGERLSTDVCWLGPPDASSVLVLVSGTHGVEALTGSACQLSWLRQRPELPPDLAVLLVHVLNPYGASWLRRQTEDNVDLNRNFVDFTASLPSNELYVALHPHILCPEWEGPRREEARIAIRALRAAHGDHDYAAALMRGQYAHPNGVGYGGTRRSWSRRIFEELVRHYLDGRRQVCVVDFHTGFGPFGVGTPVVAQGGDVPSRVAGWLGEPIVRGRTPLGALPYEVRGDLISGIGQLLPRTVVTGVNLVFGTYDLDRLLELLVADCWVHNFGDAQRPPGSDVRRSMREFFFPGTEPWLRGATERARTVIERLALGLAAQEPLLGTS